jgi:hypothetical protein
VQVPSFRHGLGKLQRTKLGRVVVVVVTVVVIGVDKVVTDGAKLQKIP